MISKMNKLLKSRDTRIYNILKNEYVQTKEGLRTYGF